MTKDIKASLSPRCSSLLPYMSAQVYSIFISFLSHFQSRSHPGSPSLWVLSPSLGRVPVPSAPPSPRAQELSTSQGPRPGPVWRELHPRITAWGAGPTLGPLRVQSMRMAYWLWASGPLRARGAKSGLKRAFLFILLHVCHVVLLL